MIIEQQLVPNEQIQRAISELQETILQQYPATTFEIGRDPDEPGSINMFAIVDVDDPDVVGDLVIDRVLELTVEEGIPVHVVPVRTPERIAAGRRARRKGQREYRPFLLTRLGLLEPHEA